MIKIGNFSRISQVSVKTLRYYDEMGLLKPVEVDPFTGYRYYALDQLPRLYRILALKDLGFSLEQISKLICEEIPLAELRGMLRLKQAELRVHVQEELARLDRIETRLNQIEQETAMPDYDILLKKVEPILVASVRDIIPAYAEQGPLWARLETYLRQQGTSPSAACFTVYHSEEPEIDAEVCEPLAAPVEAGNTVQVYELPAVELVASVVHHGPFTTLGDAYSAVLKWIESSGYQCAGPVREIYLRAPSMPGNQMDPDTVTEIQFPVDKVR